MQYLHKVVKLQLAHNLLISLTFFFCLAVSTLQFHLLEWTNKKSGDLYFFCVCLL